MSLRRIQLLYAPMANTLCGLLFVTPSAAAAPPAAAVKAQEIEQAIDRGVRFLKQSCAPDQRGKPFRGKPGGWGEGETALAGLAMLECGVPANDPVIRSITAAIREAAFSETQTYHLALYILYLDRLGDKSDVPIIQMLAVRLLAGQNAAGGWSYRCPLGSNETVAWLRSQLLRAELRTGDKSPVRPPPAPSLPKNSKLAAPPKGRLHPVVSRYAAELQASWDRRELFDDNSNTQFAILGVWAARKHGVFVEEALDLIEKRFLTTQCRDGGWPYIATTPGSPSMTCAGLLGLATAIGRREERHLRSVAPSVPPQQLKPGAPPPVKPPDDPFFQPPTTGDSPARPQDPFFEPPLPKPSEPPAPKKKAEPKEDAGRQKLPFRVRGDARDAAVLRGLENLAAVLQGQVAAKVKWARDINHDYYFWWSVERVGVIFGLEKIGPVRWYEHGAAILVDAQNPDGSWQGGHGQVVDTAFALLFLCRSNFVRDLTRFVQGKPSDAELRSGGEFVPAPAPMPRPDGSGSPTPSPQPAPDTPIARSPDPSGPGLSEPSVPRASDPPRGETPSLPETPLPKLPRNEPPPRAALPTPAQPDDHNPPPDPLTAGLMHKLIQTPDARWKEVLNEYQNGKGSHYTQALLRAIPLLDPSRQAAVRQALAERLARMTAETLRQYLQSPEAELRRAAALAMAMKDDRIFIPDLIAALLDEEELVVRAAHTGLKSLTGQDFGPPPRADVKVRARAAQAWLDWLRGKR